MTASYRWEKSPRYIKKNRGSRIIFATLGQDDMSQSKFYMIAEQFPIENENLTYGIETSSIYYKIWNSM